MTVRARQFAALGRLAVFAGAGVSSIPPTCLPSWWAMNRSVLTALRDRAAELVGPDRAEALAHAVSTRQESHKFPPEYQAEVIVRKLQQSYFRVLQCLDSDTPNAVHLGIAALAGHGRVPAVITTNFDRALEAAFTTLRIPFEVFSKPAHFQALAGNLERIGESGRACPILKLHGSADDPTTLVDTLSQRKRGFSKEVAACVRHLLQDAHWLFLGYSGADLMADENYLFLKPDAAQARGFTWLLRTKEEPVEALTKTRDAYGGRSEIVHGELPDWLAELSQGLLPDAFPRTPDMTAEAVDEIRRTAAANVTRHATEWAAAERFDLGVLVFADLLDAVGEPAGARELLQRLYDRGSPEERRSPHFAVVVNALANSHTQTSEFDRASALFEEALAILDPATLEEQHVGALNNLALVYEKRGQTTEALASYERVLAIAEKTGNPASRGVALHNLAIIRHRLGQDEEAERLYLEELDIVQRLGDEEARAFALNNLGELHVSRRQFVTAVEYLGQAVQIRDRIGDDLGAAHSRANLANAHFEQPDYQAAFDGYGECLEVFRRFGDRADAARTLANIARTLKTVGQPDKALAVLDEVLKEATAIHSDPIRALGLQLLGEIQQNQRRNREAFGTFRGLVDLVVRMRDAKRERDARMGCGIALKALPDPAAALPFLRDALALTDRHTFPARDWVLEHLGDAYLWLDRLDEASAAFKQIVDAAANYQDRATRMNRIARLAQVQFDLGAVARGLRVLEDCRQWNADAGLLPDAAACLVNLGSILKQMGDVARARIRLQEAVTILERTPGPLLDVARQLLEECG